MRLRLGNVDDGAEVGSDAWAIDLAVQSVLDDHEVAAAAPGAAAMDVRVKHSRSARPAEARRPLLSPRGRPAMDRGQRPLWLFGSHHKTGTYLIWYLAQFQNLAMNQSSCSIAGLYGPCGMFGPSSCWTSPQANTWFDCHVGDSSLAKIRKQVAEENLRVVHIIRDPLAMVVSGYVYHTTVGAGDRAPPGIEHLSLEEGMAKEAEVAMQDSLPEMLSAHRWAKANGNSSVLTVRLEDFLASSDSFDTTVRRTFNFTVGDLLDHARFNDLCELAKNEDLRRHPDPAHSTSLKEPELKARAKKALFHIPKALLADLHAYRRELGYA